MTPKIVPLNPPEMPAEPEYGMCPILSVSALAQSQAPAGVVVPLAAQVTTVTGYSPCIGGKCQWWDPEEYRCAVWNLGKLVAAVDRVGNLVQETGNEIAHPKTPK